MISRYVRLAAPLVASAIAATFVVTGARTSTTLAAQMAQTPAAPATPQTGGGQGNRTRAQPADFSDNAGWTRIFDGSTMTGWGADPALWSIVDGAIHITATCEKPVGTVYAVWEEGEVADFMLKAEIKLGGNINSGIQYRAWLSADPNAPQRPGRTGGPAPAGGARAGGAAGAGGGGGRGAAANTTPCPSGAARGTPPSGESQAKWNLGGPQYDFDWNNAYSGQYFEQNMRGIVAYMGEVVEGLPGGRKQLLSNIANVEGVYKKDEWNQVLVVAVGNVMTHFMNGQLMSQFIDNDPATFRSSGKIGIQAQGLGEVNVRNIYLKKL